MDVKPTIYVIFKDGKPWAVDSFNLWAFTSPVKARETINAFAHQMKQNGVDIDLKEFDVVPYMAIPIRKTAEVPPVLKGQKSYKCLDCGDIWTNKKAPTSCWKCESKNVVDYRGWKRKNGLLEEEEAWK